MTPSHQQVREASDFPRVTEHINESKPNPGLLEIDGDGLYSLPWMTGINRRDGNKRKVCVHSFLPIRSIKAETRLLCVHGCVPDQETQYIRVK